MAHFTPEMESEYDFLMNEANRVIFDESGVAQRMYGRALWTNRPLFQEDPHWIAHSSFTTTLRDMRIVQAATDITNQPDYIEWLIKQEWEKDPWEFPRF